MYDGSTSVFEALSRPDYGTAIGILPDGKILLAWDAQPDREPLLTSIGGRIEATETPEQGTKREFLEETGYRVGKLVPFFVYSPSWKTRYAVHMFVARDLTKTQEPMLDAGEKIELRMFSFDDFLRLGSETSKDLGGPVRDWMLRVKLLEAQIDKKKRGELYNVLYD